MKISPSREELLVVLKKQLDNNFGLNEAESLAIDAVLDAVLRDLAYCFGFSRNKYYRQGGDVHFYIYHSAQYCIFLYMLARMIFLRFPRDSALSDKLYLLNKMLNGLDLYYQVEMPAVFHVDHPVGSVIGRARIGDGFSFSQGCTVGNNKGVYPVIGKNVIMMSDSKILGRSCIGDNVIIAANSYLKDFDVPDNSVVFGVYPDIVVKPRKYC